jgi:O-antigen ligase
MSRFQLLLAGAIVLCAPFGEGGRAPLSLLLLQTLAILFILVAGLRAARPALPGTAQLGTRTVAIAISAGLGLACMSASRAAYPLAAGLGVTDLLAAGGLFLAALAVRVRAGDPILLRNVLVASTSIQSLLAMVRYAKGGVAAAGSEFLNPNHLAAFLNLGLLACVAAAEDRAATPGRRGRILWAAAGALHLMAVLLLASRGAFLGLAAAGAVWIAARWSAWPTRRRAAVTAGTLALVLLGAALVTLRFARDHDPFRYHRLAIWSASLEMVRDSPWIGHGPGMFPHVSSRYNFPVDQGPVRYGRTFTGAHSALLTLAAEDGVLFAACALVAGVLAVVLLARQARRGDPGAVALGGALGIFALLAQGLVEDLQTRPALVLVPALLAGILLGSRRRVAVDEAAPGGRANPRRPRPAATTAAAALLAAAVFLGVALLPYLADHEASAARVSGRAGLPRMERAARLNPWHPEYHHDLAMAAINSDTPAADRYAEASLQLREAARLKPSDYRFPLLRARLEDRIGGPVIGDRSAPVRATALYEEAARLSPLDPRPLLELAAHLASQGRFDDAVRATTRALEIEPNFLRARILQVWILKRLGRAPEAERAVRSLRDTIKVLAEYTPDSTYARDLVADAPGEREQFLASPQPVPSPPGHPGTG